MDKNKVPNLSIKTEVIESSPNGKSKSASVVKKTQVPIKAGGVPKNIEDENISQNVKQQTLMKAGDDSKSQEEQISIKAGVNVEKETESLKIVKNGNSVTKNEETKTADCIVPEGVKISEKLVAECIKTKKNDTLEKNKDEKPSISEGVKPEEPAAVGSKVEVSDVKFTAAKSEEVAISNGSSAAKVPDAEPTLEETKPETETKSECNMELKTDDGKVKRLNGSTTEEESASTPSKSSGDELTVDLDKVSVASVKGSSGSDITPPPSCFNWFQKFSSPQRFMSKLKTKRDSKTSKSHKSDFPSLKSQVSDPNDLPTEFVVHGNEKYYENVFIGVFTPPEDEIERIDYASLAEEKIIPSYLGAHPCYDVMPTSGKVIILSVELLVKNAFSALVSNDIKAAPLWDASCFDFIGMLTISDFINVLRHYYYSSPEDIKDIENQSISTWRRITRVEKPFVKVNGSDSLIQATKLLIQDGIHRIPVFDEKRQSVMFVLTRKRLLHFLSNSLFENFEKANVRTPSFFRKTIRELKIGTYEDIATVEISTKVIDTLDLFVKRKVSSLPVVDKDNILLDIFEKFDVFQLAKEQTYHNLDMPIKEAISKADVRETAWICTLDETLGTVINRFVNNKVHRIVVTNEKRAVVGMISLSDVLKFLVLNPLEHSSLSTTTETIEEDTEGAVGGNSSEPGSSAESAKMADSLDEDSTLSDAVETLKIEHPSE